MPAQPSWLQRVPDILAELSSPAAPPFLDRPSIERLFNLHRRQAIRLLSVCGGYQVGRTFVVPRAALITYVNTFVKFGAVDFAVRRKLRILDQLNSVRRVSLRVDPEVRQSHLSSLPKGVLLQPGLLQVEFDGPVQLLEKLYALAQAVSNDFAAFEKRVVSDG